MRVVIESSIDAIALSHAIRWLESLGIAPRSKSAVIRAIVDAAAAQLDEREKSMLSTTKTAVAFLTSRGYIRGTYTKEHFGELSNDRVLDKLLEVANSIEEEDQKDERKD